MGQITAWKIDETGEVFEDKKKYSNRLRVLSRQKKQKEKEAYIISQEFTYFANVRATCRNPGQIVKFIEDNWDTICDYMIMRPHWTGRKYAPRKNHPKLLRMTLDINWKDKISNSHCCPLNGVDNWDSHRHPEKPTGYPGWYGRFSYTHENCPIYAYGSELWRDFGSRKRPSCIHTHSGGGGNPHSWDVTLWADDWTAMAESWAMARTYKELQHNDFRTVENIAINDFDTTEKVEAFKKKYPDDLIELAKEWRDVTLDGQTLGNIIHLKFNTEQGIAEFKAKLPEMQNRLSEAKTWRALSNDRRVLSEIIAEIKERDENFTSV